MDDQLIVLIFKSSYYCMHRITQRNQLNMNHCMEASRSKRSNCSELFRFSNSDGFCLPPLSKMQCTTNVSCEDEKSASQSDTHGRSNLLHDNDRNDNNVDKHAGFTPIVQIMRGYQSPSVRKRSSPRFSSSSSSKSKVQDPLDFNSSKRRRRTQNEINSD